MDLEETRSILRRKGISPNKLKGQNFLIDDRIAKREVAAAGIKRSDIVLEIGPGLGALTEHLLETRCRVIAIEKDPLIVELLKQRFTTERLEIIQADVLKTVLPEFDIIVSNPPYVISSPITFKLLDRDFKIGVMTYQEEFARRLVAFPGDWDYSRLSVMSQYYFKTRILEIIPPDAFYPRPKIRSALVEIKKIKKPFKVDEQRFFKLVRGMFTVKKKTVKNAILITKKIEGLEIDLEKIPGKLKEKRVFEMSPEEIAWISNLAV